MTGTCEICGGDGELPVFACMPEDEEEVCGKTIPCPFCHPTHQPKEPTDAG